MNNQNKDRDLDPQTNSEDSVITPHISVPPPLAFQFQRPARRWMVPLGLGVLALGGVGLVLFNRFIWPALRFSQMTPPAPIWVPLSPVKAATIEDSSDYAVALDSGQSLAVQPKVSGRILALYVKPGDRVRAGQKLLQLDAEEQRLLMARRKAGVSNAAAEVEAAKAEITNAEETLRSLQERQTSAQANMKVNQEDYKRFQDLFKAGATSKQSLDQKQNAIQMAQTELDRAKADVQAQQSGIAKGKAQIARNQKAVAQAKANLSEGNAQLRNYTIAAPFPGVVSNISAKLGAMASPTTPLLTLTPNDRVEVQFQVSSERSSKLKRGQVVKLLNDKNQAVRSGKISSIAPMDPTSQSVQAKAAFTNVGDVLQTSQFIKARVIWSSHSGLLVPTTAISRLEGKDFIFVAQPFQSSECKATVPKGSPLLKIEPNQMVANQQSIQLGKMMGNNQEVLAGLSPGDRIGVSGIAQLQNCAPITTQTFVNPG
jgi:RND family efflux transporter MFP subunit